MRINKWLDNEDALSVSRAAQLTMTTETIEAAWSHGLEHGGDDLEWIEGEIEETAKDEWGESARCEFDRVNRVVKVSNGVNEVEIKLLELSSK